MPYIHWRSLFRDKRHCRGVGLFCYLKKVQCMWCEGTEFCLFSSTCVQAGRLSLPVQPPWEGGTLLHSQFLLFQGSQLRKCTAQTASSAPYIRCAGEFKQPRVLSVKLKNAEGMHESCVNLCVFAQWGRGRWGTYFFDPSLCQSKQFASRAGSWEQTRIPDFAVFWLLWRWDMALGTVLCSCGWPASRTQPALTISWEQE